MPSSPERLAAGDSKVVPLKPAKTSDLPIQYHNETDRTDLRATSRCSSSMS